MIWLTALSQNFDPRLALSVAWIESSFNPELVGKAGDTGLFQVVHWYVPETQEELLDPKLNAEVGIRVLKQMRRKCSDMSDAASLWVLCYNHGVTGAHRIEQPLADKYYLRVSSTKDCLYQYKQKEILSGKANRCFK